MTFSKTSLSTSWGKLTDYLRTFLPPAWLIILAGIASISYGQYLMESRETLGEPLPVAEQWNKLYNLEIVNYNNVFYALPYMFGGAIACLLFVRPSSWQSKTDDQFAYAESSILGLWRSKPKRMIPGILLFLYLLVQLGNHRYLSIHPFIWLLAIWLITTAIFKLDESTKISLSPALSAADLIWIASLLALGFGVASWALEDLPLYIIPDEGSFWETARAIAIGELHPPLFGSGVYTFPVASSIFQGWVLKIFGQNLWGWRFSSVIPAVITIIPLYLLAREWFGRACAITACVLMIANPYFVTFSRLGYNNSQSLFPVTLCIYFFAMAMRRGGFFYIWLAGLAAGAGFYTYSSSWIGLVIIVISLLLLGALKTISWNRVFLTFGLVAAAWAIVYLPRIAYTASGTDSHSLSFKVFETSFINPFYADAYYDADELTTLIEVGDGQKIFYEPTIYRELLLRGTIRTFVAMFDPHIIHEHLLNTALPGVISPIFFLVGLFLSLRNVNQIRFSLPLIWFLSGFIFLSLIGAFPPRQTHLVAVIPGLALLAAIALTGSVEALFESMLDQREKLRLFLQYAVVSIIVLGCLYFGVRRYFVQATKDYPALFEDYVSWIAWHTEEPAHLVYVSDTPGPYRVEYLLNVHLARHTFNSYKLSEFAEIQTIPPGKKTIIFLETQLPQNQALFDKLSSDFHEPVSFLFRKDYVLGYAISNTEADLAPDLTLETGVRSLVGKPVGFVLLGLFISMVVLGGLSVSRSRLKFPEYIHIELGKLAEHEGQPERAGKNEMVSGRFYLNIFVPLQRRKRSGQTESSE